MIGSPARRDLSDPLLGAPIGAVAARRGFTSPAHFSPAFRAVYGLSLASSARGPQRRAEGRQTLRSDGPARPHRHDLSSAIGDGGDP
ncbi:hypothetical protein GCM10010187_46590 [Actinomadura coerulea]|nr:hypothetical protein GCM10010187_46590 [Actinomadura coerulea]